MTKVHSATSSISPPAVSMQDYRDWTARKAASYGRVLENALAKIKKEVEVASYSNLPIAVVSFKDVLQPTSPASEWEWDPKVELQTRSLVTQKVMEKPRKQSYGSSFRRKGIDLQPRRPEPPKVEEGPRGSVFQNYRQNPNLRKQTLLYIAIPPIRPHYNVVLQHHESILKPRPVSPGEIPTLMELSARAFGRAIILARDPADLEGDSKWYAHCDENSVMYRFLAETVRGHIIQLLVEAMKQDWFPEDLAATMIAQCVNAGDVYLTETFFRAAYESTFDGNRSIARRRGELAPDPWSQILYMPDVLFRQLRIATDIRTDTMLDNWFCDVLLAGISEMGSYMEIPGYTLHCLELLLGIETWESGLQRRRLNRSGKQMRKKRDDSFKQGWLFQAKDIIVYKAAKTVEDLVARLFEVGWKGTADEEHKVAARDVMGTLVQRMIIWSEAFNHPTEELLGVTSRSARALALCAGLLGGEELGISAQKVVGELVELLLVITVENTEEPKTVQDSRDAPDVYDVRDLADDIAGAMKKVWDSFDKQKEFMELLLALAVENPEPGVTETPVPGDKSKLLQKRQSYLLATFAYHLATSIAESSKSDAAHVFATKVEQTLVGMKIWRGGLLKASDLKTPKFSNLVRDLALTDARNNGWRWEPMLNDWVESTADSDGDGAKVVRKVSRRLFEHPKKRTRTQVTVSTSSQVTAEHSEGHGSEKSKTSSNPFSPESDTENSDYREGDSSIYPTSADTTLTEPDIASPGSPQQSASSSFLLEVCIPSRETPSTEVLTAPGSIGSKISYIFKQAKRTRSGAPKDLAYDEESITVQPPTSSHEKRKRFEEDDGAISDSQDDSIEDVIVVAPPRKRGRPRKNTETTTHAQPACESSPDSAYEPDSDDDYEQPKHQKNNKRLSLGQVATGDKSYETRSAQKRKRGLDIYQDELDLTSSTPLKKRGKRWSTGAIVLKDTGKSKLNENATRRRRKSDLVDVTDITPVGRGRPRKRVL
ncbi:hypothetical protein TWF281_008121 [Arthrobotrys megalospora]